MSQELIEGQAAPEFQLKDQNSKLVKLSDFKGKFVILYFYPKDDTPGCTKEACSFKDNLKTIEGKNAVVLGVSLDEPESHVKFINKFNLNFPLLCDEDTKVSKLYGVYKKKNMYGRVSWGIERSTFIIDGAGKIKKIFKRVKVDGHTEQVLNLL